MLKNGWHIIKGYKCYVENNRILKCLKYDHNGSPAPAAPYRKYTGPGGGWINASGVNVNTFRHNNYTVL